MPIMGAIRIKGGYLTIFCKSRLNACAAQPESPD
jgi:hypothetical protein